MAASSRSRSGGRRYGKAAGKSVKSAMHREKRGTLKSGKGGKGGTVKSRKQAVIGYHSEARKKGAKSSKENLTSHSNDIFIVDRAARVA